MLFLFSAKNADCQRFNTVNFTTQEGLPGNHLNSIIQDKIGRLWIGTMSGARRFDGKTFVRFDQGNVLLAQAVGKFIVSAYHENKK